MIDLKQVALEFVLADDQPTLKSLAQQAASEIQNAPPSTNPVARWVESVQPWMPSLYGDDVDDEGEENTNWTARAKAMEFLSQTLGFLSDDVLRPNQVKLLVGFFGAMFDVDHKAGILASATALSKIVSMTAFQPQSGNDIIQSVCTLKDDFPRQVSKTRVAIYNLLRSLVTNPAVASDLQYQHGAPSGFMNDLLQLCKNERDPDCLMVWFDTLRFFLAEYESTQEMADQIYETFKAYFPITLPRTSPSGITPEDLKLRLRSCFSSDYRLAKDVYPFLLARLDQGDGVTVNVKVDVLRTVKACVEEFKHPEQSVVPFINQIWSSLKYEVRNGEIEDTIWATLEVLKTIATRLHGDSLRDYTLTVTRDCVNDLSNTTYTSGAGRLLVSVLSANPSSFILMVAPAVTHIKENLRHPKSPLHTQDLLRLLHVILETRLLLTASDMTAQDMRDFGAIDIIFKSLYEDVYKVPVGLGSKADASYDDIKVATQAVQGAGALVCQRPVKASDPSDRALGTQSDSLIPEATCSQIIEALFTITLQSIDDNNHKSGSDELVNETTKALQRATTAFTSGFRPLVDRGLSIIRSSRSSPESIQALGPLLAFIGCSELSASPSESISHFIYYILAILKELFAALDAKAEPRTWCALVAAIQSAARYFNDACLVQNPETDQPRADDWQSSILAKYPDLATISEDAASVPSSDSMPSTSRPMLSTTEARNDFLLIGLFIAQQLYRRALKHSEDRVGLSDDFTGSDSAAELQYLHLVSGFASFIVHELSEAQQLSLHVEKYALNLFRQEIEIAPTPLAEEEMSLGFEKRIREKGSSWSWLVLGKLNVLSLAILEALRPSAIARLFENGIAQELLISGVFWRSDDPRTSPVTRSLLTLLANKFKIETLEKLMATLAEGSTQELSAQEELDQVTSIFAVAAGLLRRYSGKNAQGILQVLRNAPQNTSIGHRLARRLEMVVAPQTFLTKENFAVVKPLWIQKIYFELAKPLLQAALGADQDPLIKTNLSVGVLLLVKHMNYAVYEDDAESLLRVAISIAQNLGTGPETRAALDVLRNILAEAPEKAEEHVRSLVNICVASFSGQSAPAARPAWLPADYSSAAGDAEAQAACGKLALEIVGGLPKILESRHLVPHARQMERELTLACGHKVRDLRRTARAARAAWVELK